MVYKAMNLSLLTYCLLSITIIGFLLLKDSNIAEDFGFILDSRSGILQRSITNAGNHLYPYVATVFTCGCILVCD
jgi:hypothetical protein